MHHRASKLLNAVRHLWIPSTHNFGATCHRRSQRPSFGGKNGPWRGTVKSGSSAFRLLRVPGRAPSAPVAGPTVRAPPRGSTVRAWRLQRCRAHAWGSAAPPRHRGEWFYRRVSRILTAAVHVGLRRSPGAVCWRSWFLGRPRTAVGVPRLVHLVFPRGAGFSAGLRVDIARVGGESAPSDEAPCESARTAERLLGRCLSELVVGGERVGKS